MKQAVEGFIANKVSQCLEQVESALIFQGALLQVLGYSADTDTAKMIVEGTFNLPEDTSPTPLIILEEIARV